MNKLQEMVLIGEIVLQSQIAQKAAARLELTNTTFDRIEVWCSIQSILVSAGNVSKILWPNKKYEIRGEHLRQLLKVDEGNPLSNRKFRNHFEHYDERIEEWFESRDTASYSDLSINPKLRTPSLNEKTTRDHRGYNSFDNTLLFRDEILDLNLILKSLHDILAKCKPYVLA